MQKPRPRALMRRTLDVLVEPSGRVPGHRVCSAQRGGEGDIGDPAELVVGPAADDELAGGRSIAPSTPRPVGRAERGQRLHGSPPADPGGAGRSALTAPWRRPARVHAGLAGILSFAVVVFALTNEIGTDDREGFTFVIVAFVSVTAGLYTLAGGKPGSSN